MLRSIEFAVRVAIGTTLFGCVFGYFREAPEIGILVGVVVGSAFFLLVMVAKLRDAIIVIRSYTFSIIGIVVFLTLAPAINGASHLGTTITGAITGWLAAAIVTQYRLRNNTSGLVSTSLGRYTSTDDG